jgi:hypothetical protein
MPAFVNNKVASPPGTNEDDETKVCCLWTKKSINDWRTSAPVMDFFIETPEYRRFPPVKGVALIIPRANYGCNILQSKSRRSGTLPAGLPQRRKPEISVIGPA